MEYLKMIGKINGDASDPKQPNNITPKQVKFNKAKFKALTITAVLIILIIITFISYSYTTSSTEEKISKINSLKIQIMNAGQDMAKLENRIKEFESVKKIWEKVKDSNIKRNGIDFDKARAIIDDLNKSKFLAAPINVNLSPPSMSVRDEKSSIGIEISIMDINVNAVSDIYALKVAQIFAEHLPGFLKYNSFRLTRIKDVSNDVIDNLNKGFFPVMVDLSIQVKWQNLKDINK